MAGGALGLQASTMGWVTWKKSATECPSSARGTMPNTDSTE